MRELVYLSEAKLKQFLPELSTLWPRPRLSVKVPPFAGLDLDLTPTVRKSQLKHLERVVAQIAETAAWFTEPELRPGQWAAFEAPLNYLVLDHPQFSRMLLFAETLEGMNESYSEHNVRLLLHGSAEYLLEAARPAELVVDSSDGITNCECAPAFTRMIDNIEPLLEVLERQGEPQKPIDQLPPSPSSSGGRPSLDILDVEHVAYEPARDRMPAATTRLLRAIDNEMSPETGAWMTGYARITANLQDQPKRTESAMRYIVATPLYVEYSSQPDR